MKWVSKYFVNGLIVIVPIAITFFVIQQIFAITDKIIGRYIPLDFPGVALIAVFTFIIIIGWLSTHWLAKQIFEIGEKVVESIPVIKVIYISVKKISTAVFQSHQLLKNAVLVPYPYPQSKVLGFVMTDLSPAIAQHLPEEHICVFIPWSLNITSGVNIIVPKRDIIPLDVTSESALQYVITAGTIMPQCHDVTKS